MSEIKIVGLQRVDWQCRTCGKNEAIQVDPSGSPESLDFILASIATKHRADCGEPRLEWQRREPVQCPDCGAYVADGSGDCASCGADIRWYNCPKCGNSIRKNATECKGCSRAEIVRRYDRGTWFIRIILFVGVPLGLWAFISLLHWFWQNPLW
jgi:predicted RNA-binding Zn-ribbon protein involved in translation (DUF1610 family)